MKTSRDLCDEKGLLILVKGQILSDSLIDKSVRLQDSFDEALVIHTEGA